MNNFDNYLFRCSFLPTLMVNGRVKGEILSETAKTGLRELWIKEVFKREKYITTKQMEKGIACESDSLDLVQQATGKTYFKNKKEFSNDFIKGTPDVITEDSVIDIKTSWDIWTFNDVDGSKAEKTYFYQVAGYMWLTGKKVSEIAYCLVNTPEEIIADELHKLSFRFPEINESEENEAKYRKNYIFDDIEPKLRIKKFEFALTDEHIELLKERIVAGREYMNSLSL